MTMSNKLSNHTVQYEGNQRVLPLNERTKRHIARIKSLRDFRRNLTLKELVSANSVIAHFLATKI